MPIKHDTVIDPVLASVIRRMRASYWKQVWQRLGATSEGRPVAIYGAGRHTKRFLALVQDLEGGPRLAFILDDFSKADEVAGVPVRSPDNADPAEVACVLVSSDTIEDLLTERAELWSGGKVPVERLNGNAFDAEVLNYIDERGVFVERTPEGKRIVTDEVGNERTDLPTTNPNRPPSAIDPITERMIGVFRTPEYTVSKVAIVREVDETFKPHQVYPGDRHRPGIDLRDESFVTHSEPGLVTPETRVSVIGSCFASNLKLWLLEHGYNFCQFEDGPNAAPGSLSTGPLFNPGSVCQLIEWAYNGFDAVDPYWTYDGKLLDPYRKTISWPDLESMRAERESHMAATRAMIEESEVLILTLGLSEVWRNREDKRCYYLIPPPGMLDEKYHEHAILSVDECVDYLERFYTLARKHNQGLRLITTLSPVPLMATYFDRHAVVSDAVSKATLRVALDTFCRAHPEVIYFPSYEMVVRTPDWPYAADNRHVRRVPYVDKIMRTFISNYGLPDLNSPTDVEAKPIASQQHQEI